VEILSATLLTPTPLLADAQPTLGPMTQKQGKLCARLRQLGFKVGEPMKLYGEQYELLGDPIVSGATRSLLPPSTRNPASSEAFAFHCSS